MNYYNENDPKAAAWLRELIKARVIAVGEVDERSIADVEPKDLRRFRQCHFFAGIGGWSYALRRAGWPDERPVWTGSCPCQPFSVAGQRKVDSDERHLWPTFRALISECSPAIVFGEQVASKDGRIWLARVCADLEALGYGVGAADLCAAGVAAPHIRQRLYWMANAANQRTQQPTEAKSGRNGENIGILGAHGAKVGWLVQSNGSGRDSRQPASETARHGSAVGPASVGSWDAFELIPCLDGKTRRVESGTFPLAYGVPGRVGLLRGYGNAIVPQLAAEFIRASVEALNA